MAFWQTPCLFLAVAFGLADVCRGGDLECPPLWSRYSDNCYRFFGPPKTWQSAEEHCREFFTRYGQGHLASIHTSGENELLIQMWTTSLIPTEQYHGDFVWMGLNDQEREGSFPWSDGTVPSYQAWLEGQPDNAGQHGGEDCGSFWRVGSLVGWNDAACNTHLPYLCKMPIHM